MSIDNPNLFDGERIMDGAGIPSLTWFAKGNTAKPLVVFVPGSAHSARIAYGGHAGGRPQDFLAHWVSAQGYSFLGVSYPMSTPDIMGQDAHPDFSIRSWGRQGADITAQIVAENKLSKNIILVVWSNGGRVPQAFNEAATALGLTVDFCISFSATPPNACITVLPPASLPPQAQKLRTPDGYIDLRHKYTDWYSQIQGNQAPGEVHDIIPKKTYYDAYVGPMPVNILGQGMRHHKDGFVPSGWAYIEDSKSHDPSSYPLMTTILTNNIVDARHALTDQALWSSYLIGHLYANYLDNPAPTPDNVAPQDWLCIVNLLRDAPQRLSVATSGNHFFFVGEAGARQAAADIAFLAQQVQTFLSELNRLLDLKATSKNLG